MSTGMSDPKPFREVSYLPLGTQAALAAHQDEGDSFGEDLYRYGEEESFLHNHMLSMDMHSMGSSLPCQPFHLCQAMAMATTAQTVRPTTGPYAKTPQTVFPTSFTPGVVQTPQGMRRVNPRVKGERTVSFLEPHTSQTSVPKVTKARATHPPTTRPVSFRVRDELVSASTAIAAIQKYFASQPRILYFFPTNVDPEETVGIIVGDT